jgi:hypothetical protein
MSLSIQRLEVLLAGLLMLLAGAVVVLATVVRPPARNVYSQATPVPVHIAPTVAPTVAAVQPTASLPAPQDTPNNSHTRGIRLPALDERVRGQAWPFLLLVTGGIGLLLVARTARRRRMAYTGQSMGMLLRGATRCACCVTYAHAVS